MDGLAQSSRNTGVSAIDSLARLPFQQLAAEDKQRFEDTAACLVENVLSLEKLVDG